MLSFTGLLSSINAQDEDKDAIVIEQNQAVNHDGTYSYVWRTSNGISVQESGVGGISASGSYDFISSDGVPVSLQYEADENGYRPQSNLLPQPPAIPDYILRALEYIRNNPPSRFWENLFTFFLL